MRKVIIMFALAMGIATANAQENVTVGTDNGSEQPTLTKEVYPQKEADGDLYHGLTKKLTFDRMVPPHGLEVTYPQGWRFFPKTGGLTLLSRQIPELPLRPERK